jgi:hypothetical protein
MVTLLVAFCKSCYELARVKETDNQMKKEYEKQTNKPKAFSKTNEKRNRISQNGVEDLPANSIQQSTSRKNC